jgi:hypothetical protein
MSHLHSHVEWLRLYSLSIRILLIVCFGGSWHGASWWTPGTV